MQDTGAGAEGKAAEDFVVADGLAKSYRPEAGGAGGGETLPALSDASFTVGRGRFALLKGASGSGKSTLLSLLGGLDVPSAGRLVVDGREMTGASGSELTRYRRFVVGFVFQSFNLLPSMSALENVVLPALLAGSSASAAGTRGLALLDRLGVARLADRPPGRLSGGEAQRVAVARALINDPPLVLADEPTGNLDSVSGAAVVNLLAELAAEGRTVIMATHSGAADHLADLTLRMRDGRLLPGGAAE